MRFVIARMNHETNSFSPVPTTLDSFAPRWGKNAYQAGQSSRTAMGAFIDFANRRKDEVVTPVFAMAYPSGPVSDAAYAAMSSAIVEAVSDPCDAILLDLHGAMVTTSLDDAEGELLTRIREVAPHTPLGVALDLHGNVTPKMVAAADFIVGFKTYPHVDMYETGEHVARIMGCVLDQRYKPAQAWAHPPILAQTLRMNTNVPGAMAQVVEAARQLEERKGVLAATFFGGFPLSDLEETGTSVVVIAADDATARMATEELAREVWRVREGFVYHERSITDSVSDAIEAAAKPGDKPVLMLDHGDNCMSGGTCDTMDVLAEALRQGLSGILVGPVADPRAVAEMTAAGEGAEITVPIGNRWALSGIGVKKAPLKLKGKVRTIAHGDYIISGPIYTGMHCDMGNAAVLETDQALVLVVEEPHEPWDIGVFTCMDLEPSECNFLILKSRMYCRPVFEPVSKATVECASLGVTSSNLDLFQFKRLRRPIFPLDKMNSWSPDEGVIADS